MVVCSLVLAVAAASPAAADPKKKQPDCYLVVDTKGDAPPAVDIHSADVATGNKTLVAVIRLATTSSDDDPTASLGATWVFSFRIQGERYLFTRRRAAGAEDRYTYAFSPNPRNAVVTVTETASVVRWVVPRTAIPQLTKPGKRVLDTLTANTTLSVTNADYAASKKTYRDKDPHCLNPT